MISHSVLSQYGRSSLRAFLRDGKQTRSFLYISQCVEAIRRMMEGSFEGPLNIGSEEMISINGLAQLIIELAGKWVSIQNVPGPLGVRGRNSDNRLIREKLRWEPVHPLRLGLDKTYAWISQQVAAARQQEHLDVSRCRGEENIVQAEGNSESSLPTALGPTVQNRFVA